MICAGGCRKQARLDAGDVPTIAKQGFPRLTVIQWWDFSAPAKTLDPVIVQRNNALNEALELAEIKTQLQDMAAEPSPVTRAVRKPSERRGGELGHLVRDVNLQITQ